MFSCRSSGCKFKSQLCNKTFMEVDHEINSVVISFPSADSIRAVVNYNTVCVQKLLRGKTKNGKNGLCSQVVLFRGVHLWHCYRMESLAEIEM